MISRVFGKTKPTNYVLALGFLAVCLILAQLKEIHFGLDSFSLGVSVLIFLGLLCSAVAGNFLALSNQLIGPHVFTIYLFALMILLFPKVVLDYQTVLSNILLMGAQIRLNQIRPFKNIKANIFDASLMVLVSSLFLEWSILFFVLIWVYVYAFGPLKPRNWLVPIAAIIVFMLILSAALLASGRISFLTGHYQFNIALNNVQLIDATNSRLLVFLILVLLVFFGFRRNKITGFGKALQMRLNGLLLILVSVVIILQRPLGYEAYLLAFGSISLFLSKQIEAITKSLYRELVLLGGLLISLTVFIIGWIQQ